MGTDNPMKPHGVHLWRASGARTSHNLNVFAMIALLVTAGGSIFAESWSAINAGLPGTTAGVATVTVGPSIPSILYVRTNGGGIFKSTDGAVSWKPIGGVDDVKFLGIDPQNSSTLYAATGHGILKSADGGENWNSVNTGLTNTSVNSLAIDPVTPSTLYAVTTSGVFKSVNGGGSWGTLNAFPSSQIFAASLMIDPLTPSIIYAALWNGDIFKSEDGGESWKVMKSSPFSTGFTDYALSLAIDPLTPSTIYAGSFASFSPFPSQDGGISKSTDGGQTWNTFTTGIPSGAFVSSLAIDPTTPSTIYARTNSGVLKSTDGGVTWAGNGLLFANSVGSLAIDPSTPSTVYAGYFDFPAGGGGLFKSTDGGESWNAADAGLASFDVRVLAIDPVNAATVYTGGSGGLFKSVDRGASWTNLSTFRIAGQPFPPGLSPPFFADGPAMVRSLLIDFINPNILYVGTTRVGGCAFNDKVMFKSTDGGANWSDNVSPQSSGCLLGALNFNGSWPAMAMDPTDPNTLYVGESDDEDGIQALLKSTDGGSSWAQLGNGWGASVRTLVVDPTGSTTLYAGTDDLYSWTPGAASLFKSTDGGASWNSLGLGNASVAVLVMDPANPSILYAGMEAFYNEPRGFRGLFQSTDGGATWSAINNGLERLLDSRSRMTTLVVDPSNSKVLYAGTSGSGIFKSSDGGASWSPFNDGLGNLDVRVLAISQGDPSTLYAGTGGGVFKVENTH